ncbi:hypothetical protein PIB30_009352 [Stylosanthes scabra]|uniref:RINT1-like protein MAG2 n=1 Tax=Stylosanthes scabra TaxID=79078 RepID=A0ABU6U534_9FABA|nr:hypothetical protein [Stylosanthes scabra]
MDLLPPPSHLSPSALSFLDRKFHTKDALAEASTLSTRRLGAGLLAYASFSGDVNDRLSALASACSSIIVPDGGRGEEGDGKGFREELAALAKEVARLENVRVYAETALKLDTLIGDIEDAVSLTINKHLRKPSNQNSEEMCLVAINTLKTTEELLTSITKTQPQWKRLLSAADHRVDRALAILRPQAIADHRALLASHGWPPPLSSLTSTNQVLNPLLSMQADVRLKYSGNFLALCNLQELQRQRKARQLEGHDREVALRQPLWRISSLSVFCDRPDWLDLWAEIELGDALHKLKPHIEDENYWIKKVEGVVLSSVTDDLKSPLISSAFLRHLSAVVERCRSLPSVNLRSKFLRLAGVPIIRKFFDSVLVRCQEAEGLTALTDDDAVIKVAVSINAAHYFESVLTEWSEDVFFLEMDLDLDDKADLPSNEDRNGEVLSESSGRVILDDEIKKLEDFRTEWVERISLVILRGFDARSRDYVKNKRQWQNVEEEWTVSKTLIDALDYLQSKMSVVEEALNSRDFVGVWRSLAAGIDRLIFNGILISSVKFHNDGVERFSSDMGVLFGVFGAWCLRPEGFFPKSSEGLKLLKLNENRVEECIAGRKRWLKENGIRHLTVTDAEKVVKNRVFTS